jgi:hypothetical protein
VLDIVAYSAYNASLTRLYIQSSEYVKIMSCLLNDSDTNVYSMTEGQSRSLLCVKRELAMCVCCGARVIHEHKSKDTSCLETARIRK